MDLAGSIAMSVATTDIAIEKLTALCLIVFGFSHLLQPQLWVDFFVWMRGKGRLGSLLVGMMNLPLALIILGFHHRAHGASLIVTIIGWSLLAKSTVYLCWPAQGQRALATVKPERAWTFAVGGGFSIALGGVIAYFAVLSSGSSS